MSKEPAVPLITKARAMKLCEEIRAGLGSVADLVVELHEGQGWTALGYTTWKECCAQEFQHSVWWAGRQLRAAEVRKLLPPRPTNPPSDFGGGVPIGTGSTPHKESHLRELAKVPAEQQAAVLAWATEKAEGKPLTATMIKQAWKDIQEGEPEEEPEEEDEAPPEPIKAILTAVANGKIKATKAQLEALAKFDEELQADLLESILAKRQTVANAIEAGCVPDPTVEEIMEENASAIESLCRGITKFIEEGLAKLDDPWLDDLNRRQGAIQKFNDGCKMLRSCKCVALCPKCEGEGCAKCHKTGRVTRYTLQQLT